MDNLFGPGYAGTPLGQARESRDALINLFTPKAPPINPDDPKSIKARADMLMQQGKTEEAIRYNQMAHEVTARQTAAANANVAKAYEAVRGTPREEQFEQAMIQSGKGDLIRKIQDQSMAREAAQLRLEDQQEDREATEALQDYIRLQGDQDGQRAVLEQAREDGLSAKIEAYQDQKLSRVGKKLQLEHAQYQAQKRKMQDDIDKMHTARTPFFSDAIRAQVKAKYGESGAQYYEAQAKNRMMLEKQYQEWEQETNLAKHKYEDSDLETAGIDPRTYKAQWQVDPIAANKRAGESMTRAKVKKQARKESVSSADVKIFTDMMEAWAEAGDGFFINDDVYKNKDKIQELAYKIASAVANGDLDERLAADAARKSLEAGTLLLPRKKAK